MDWMRPSRLISEYVRWALIGKSRDSSTAWLIVRDGRETPNGEDFVDKTLTLIAWTMNYDECLGETECATQSAHSEVCKWKKEKKISASFSDAHFWHPSAIVHLRPQTMAQPQADAPEEKRETVITLYHWYTLFSKPIKIFGRASHGPSSESGMMTSNRRHCRETSQHDELLSLIEF